MDMAEYETLWMPLAHLVGRLPALKDVVHEGACPIPLCLLDLLATDRLKTCRLHIKRFACSPGHNSQRKTSTALDMSPIDLAMLTSPNLYALTLCYETLRRVDPTTVLRMVARDNLCVRELTCASWTRFQELPWNLESLPATD